MPDALRDSPGIIPPHTTMGGLEIIRVGVLLLVCALVGFLWAQTSALRATADRIVDNQNRGSALLCDNTYRAGDPLPARCFEPGVTRYRETG